jgi:hypothetical protein
MVRTDSKHYLLGWAEGYDAGMAMVADPTELRRVRSYQITQEEWDLYTDGWYTGLSCAESELEDIDDEEFDGKGI